MCIKLKRKKNRRETVTSAVGLINKSEQLFSAKLVMFYIYINLIDVALYEYIYSHNKSMSFIHRSRLWWIHVLWRITAPARAARLIEWRMMDSINKITSLETNTESRDVSENSFEWHDVAWTRQIMLY